MKFSHLLGLSAFLCSLSVTHSAFAQTLRIVPALVDSSEPVEQALQKNKGRASTSVEGNGATLLMTYRSDQQIEAYAVPLDASGRFVPTDFLRFILPQTDGGDVAIDVSISPGWKPAKQRWALHLLTKDESANAGFSRITFEPASIFSLPSIGFKQLLAPEPYTPSSYHALRGYRIFGRSVSFLLGVSTFIVVFGMFLLVPKKQRLSAVIAGVVTATALYQFRFSLDLVRYTKEHLKEFASGTYDEAGSMYQLATLLKSSKLVRPKTVYVCRDGTNYKEKLLRYYSYPIRISSEDDDAEVAEYAVVMNKARWSVETKTEQSAGSTQTLNCGALKSEAVRMAEFSDGAILFRLSQ